MVRLCSFLIILCVASSSRAADHPDYVKEIKPILQRRCYTCHGALKQKGNLRLDAISAMRNGGDSGSTIEPGKADESLLISAVLGQDGLQRMPLEGAPLTDEEITRLRQWIDAGAPAPDEPLPADPRDHWSFQRPVRAELPVAVTDEWSRNPIDRFVAAEHQKRGLTPLDEAPRNQLLRRIYLDLIGIPPTREQLAAFLQDTSPDAYEKVVDRLLASPQYGERWARHWMDVWRYSDWDGYGEEIRESQAHIWRWRDWIVESLNADQGYDQMVKDMLAADEFAPTDNGRLRATGFLVRNYFRFNRHIWMDNTVEHTGKAFLGMTFNCSRCHDHMYDPVSQVEYYQLRAIFEPYDVRTDRLPHETDVARDGLVRVYDAHHNTPTYLFVRGDDKQPQKDNPIQPAFPKSLGGTPFQSQPVELPAIAYYPGQQKYIHDELLAAAETDRQKTQAELEQAQAGLEQARQALNTFQTNPSSLNTVAILSDRFSQADPARWTLSDSRWEYRDGRLHLLEPTPTNSELVATKQIPRDFRATFRLKITGGQMWKSAGLVFDATSDQAGTGVYLSAVSGGSKVQLYTLAAGQHAYPSQGMRALPIGVGEEHTLDVLVRDQLVNVAVDGKLQFAYQLPQPRAESNMLRLFCFDSTAEFLSLDVYPLEAQVALVENVVAGQSLPVPSLPTVELLTAAIDQADQLVQKRQLQAQVKTASLASITARIAADQATYQGTDKAAAETAAQGAVLAQRELAVKQAELVRFEKEAALKVARAALKPDDEPTKTALAAAEMKLAEADKALASAKGTLGEPLHTDYARFGGVYPATSTGRRKALAEWITARDNPLTARVAINHLWLRHFHSPLVPSVFDFGLNGRQPTHPELLDWLACELMENGWHMKAIHRLMVTSRTYRSASSDPQMAAVNSKIDSENNYLWRANSHRMEAEIIRDSTLAVSKQLDTTAGGPDLDPNTGLTVGRRSLYFRSAKEKRVTFLAMFDSPNVVECYRRSESIVPQQALAMANSPLTLAQARLLSQSLNAEVGSDPHEDVINRFIDAAFLQILTRSASDAERAQCVRFLTQQTAKFSSVDKLTSFAGGTPTHVPPSTVPHLRARENLIHVLLNHNDFVTIR